MNYTQLINTILEQLELTAEDIYTLAINMDVKTITILTATFAKYVVPFPALDDPDMNQDTEPRRQTRRVKNVKKVA